MKIRGSIFMLNNQSTHIGIWYITLSNYFIVNDFLIEWSVFSYCWDIWKKLVGFTVE